MQDLGQITKSLDCHIAPDTALDWTGMNGLTLCGEIKPRFSPACALATNPRSPSMASLVFVSKIVCILPNQARDFLHPKVRQLKNRLAEKNSHGGDLYTPF